MKLQGEHTRVIENVASGWLPNKGLQRMRSVRSRGYLSAHLFGFGGGGWPGRTPLNPRPFG